MLKTLGTKFAYSVFPLGFPLLSPINPPTHPNRGFFSYPLVLGFCFCRLFGKFFLLREIFVWLSLQRLRSEGIAVVLSGVRACMIRERERERERERQLVVCLSVCLPRYRLKTPPRPSDPVSRNDSLGSKFTKFFRLRVTCALRHCDFFNLSKYIRKLGNLSASRWHRRVSVTPLRLPSDRRRQAHTRGWLAVCLVQRSKIRVSRIQGACCGTWERQKN